MTVIYIEDYLRRKLLRQAARLGTFRAAEVIQISQQLDQFLVQLQQRLYTLGVTDSELEDLQRVQVQQFQEELPYASHPVITST